MLKIDMVLVLFLKAYQKGSHEAHMKAVRPHFLTSVLAILLQ